MRDSHAMNAVHRIVVNHHKRPTSDIDQLTGLLIATVTDDRAAADLKGHGGPACTLLSAAEGLARAIYDAEGLAAQIAGKLQANPFDPPLSGGDAASHYAAANRVADRMTQLEQAATAYRQVREARDTIRSQLNDGASADAALSALDDLL